MTKVRLRQKTGPGDEPEPFLPMRLGLTVGATAYQDVDADGLISGAGTIQITSLDIAYIPRA